MDHDAATADAGDLQGVDGLGRLANELTPLPLKPDAATTIAETIDELAGGNTTMYVTTDDSGINRMAVVTDGFTLRLLMLTSSWNWRGPLVPDDPEGWLNDRGYVPASGLTDEH
jgi:hypothetical protein